MREDQAGLLVTEIFRMAQPLNRMQRLALATALVVHADRPALDDIIIQTQRGASVCDECQEEQQ